MAGSTNNRALTGLASDSIQEDPSVEPVLKTYKRRWLMLLLFSAISFTNGALYTFIVAVNDVISRYYKLRPDSVDWAGNIFPFMYIFFALPSAYWMTSLGLRSVTIIAISLNAASTCLHFAGVYSNGWAFVMCGQVLAAMSFPIVMQVPVRLSTVWFPEHEHAKATSLPMVANVFGLGVGFLQPSYMIPDVLDRDEILPGLRNVYLSHMVFVLICLVLIYLFFKEKPPLPPSFSAASSAFKTVDDSESVQAPPTMLDSIRVLAGNTNYMLLTQAYAIYVGLYFFYVTCLNDMVKSFVAEKDIGWMGFIADILAIFSILVSSVFIDKFKAYQKTSLVLTFGVLVAWTLYTFAMLRWKTTLALYLTYGGVSFFGAPFFVIGIEYAAELTYPISEGITSAIILMLGNLYGFLLVLFLGGWLEKGRLVIVSYTVVGLYALCFLLLCLVRQKLNRHDAEAHHHPRQVEPERDPLI